METERQKWAFAIAERIADEWYGKRDFPEDVALLRKFLNDSLLKSPNACAQLIGTGIIEEDYFEPLT